MEINSISPLSLSLSLCRHKSYASSVRLSLRVDSTGKKWTDGRKEGKKQHKREKVKQV
jgi:hypothetical protein